MDNTYTGPKATAWGEISITDSEGEVFKSNKDWAICKEHGSLETLLASHVGKSLTVTLTIKPASDAASKKPIGNIDKLFS